GNAVHAAMQLVQLRCHIASAYTAFERPLRCRVPYQVSARADMAAEGIVMVVACAECQHEVVGETPFIFGEEGESVLLVLVGYQAVRHVRAPVLAAHSQYMRFAHRCDKFGVENGVGGFYFSSCANAWISRGACLGRYGTAQ